MTFTRASDLIIVLMTFDRLRVMMNIDKVVPIIFKAENLIYFPIPQVRLRTFQNPQKELWIRMQTFLAILFSLVCHLPYFFQYQIVPDFCTNPREDIENDKSACLLMEKNCWTHCDLYAESVIFLVFSVAYQVIYSLFMGNKVRAHFVLT